MAKNCRQKEEVWAMVNRKTLSVGKVEKCCTEDCWPSTCHKVRNEIGLKTCLYLIKMDYQVILISENKAIRIPLTSESRGPTLRQKWRKLKSILSSPISFDSIFCHKSNFCNFKGSRKQSYIIYCHIRLILFIWNKCLKTLWGPNLKTVGLMSTGKSASIFSIPLVKDSKLFPTTA